MTLVTPTPPWSREKLLGRIDGSVKRISRPGIIYGLGRGIYTFFVGGGRGVRVLEDHA